MVSLDYNLWTKSISFKFRCPKCGEILESDTMTVPSPNYQGDTQSDSEEREEFVCECEHCGRIINGELVSGIYYGTVVLPELDEDEIVDYNCEDYDDYDAKEADYGFYTEAHVALDAIEVLPEETKGTLYRLLYANAFAYIEAYLRDNLRSRILENEQKMEEFEKIYKEIKKRRKCSKNKEQESIRTKAKEHLDQIVYHRFQLVKEVFQRCINIDLGNMESWQKALSIRNDIIHRNGKTKDGETIVISKEDVDKIWDEVFEVIKNVDSQKAMKLFEQIVAEK